MTIFQSILLGIVQGMTEFIPISSSGHLVIVPYLLGWDFPPAQAFAFDVLVQVATLVGVVAFFWPAIFPLVPAGLLIAAERIGKRSRKLESLTWKDALWIGTFQALALFPGVSR